MVNETSQYMMYLDLISFAGAALVMVAYVGMEKLVTKWMNKRKTK